MHLGQVDGRCKVARRWRDIYEILAEELGGVEALSEIQKTILRRAVSLIIQGEMIDARLAKGEWVNPLQQVRLSGALNRALRFLRGETEPPDDFDDVQGPSLEEIQRSFKEGTA